MLCPNCGSEVAADAEVCARCGCILFSDAAEGQTDDEAVAETEIFFSDESLYQTEMFDTEMFDNSESDLTYEQSDENLKVYSDVYEQHLGVALEDSVVSSAGIQEEQVPELRAPTAESQRDSTLRVAGIIFVTALTVVSLGVFSLLGDVVGDAYAGDTFHVQPSVLTTRDDTSDAADEADTSDESSEQDVVRAVHAPVGWDRKCVDSCGNPTVFALTELSGEQLQELLQQLNFDWAQEDGAWSTDHAALYAFDSADGYLDAEAMAVLDMKSGSEAIYQLAANDYETADAAYAALVSDVLESEDSEFADGAGFGIAHGPAMVDYLIEVTEGDDHISLFVFGPGSMKAGLFDELAHGVYGSTAREAFESVTGRAPGAQRQ